MIYTVVWQPTAEAALATLWNQAFDRAAVAKAADTIDAFLRHDPLSRGESRSKNFRILFVAPLAVHFEVVEKDRIVKVLKVWRF
jgi:hypothetical protein